ncbi:hypothetical protein AB4J90_01630 [Geobacillus thermodenitrificans]|nr:MULTISPECIES: hypothetical protein [Geobacillus]NNU88531.1 hypothetical protein [Geobacillus sp. MR]PJW19251.1 hypothetical protein CV632_17055 [Geobacillus thermodenitrificans]
MLVKVSDHIVNEVKGIKYVLYDITSNPLAPIQWE